MKTIMDKLANQLNSKRESNRSGGRYKHHFADCE